MDVKKDRREQKSILDYWQLILVLSGGLVAIITFYNNVKNIVDDQKNFKATVDARRDKNHDDMESIRTRLVKLEQWKEDRK